MTQQLPTLRTRDEVADYFSVSLVTVDRWIKDGLLESVKVGPRARRITEQSILDAVERGRIGGHAA